MLVLELGANFLKFKTKKESRAWCLTHQRDWCSDQCRKILNPFHPIKLSLYFKTWKKVLMRYRDKAISWIYWKRGLEDCLDSLSGWRALERINFEGKTNLGASSALTDCELKKKKKLIPVQEIFMKHLWWARHGARGWGHNKQSRHSPNLGDTGQWTLSGRKVGCIEYSPFPWEIRLVGEEDK